MFAIIYKQVEEGGVGRKKVARIVRPNFSIGKGFPWSHGGKRRGGKALSFHLHKHSTQATAMHFLQQQHIFFLIFSAQQSLHHRTLALLLEVLPRPVTAAVRCAVLIVWSVLNAFGKAYVVA